MDWQSHPEKGKMRRKGQRHLQQTSSSRAKPGQDLVRAGLLGACSSKPFPLAFRLWLFPSPCRSLCPQTPQRTSRPFTGIAFWDVLPFQRCTRGRVAPGLEGGPSSAVTAQSTSERGRATPRAATRSDMTSPGKG